jgi:nucleoid DNA-binding protein
MAAKKKAAQAAKTAQATKTEAMSGDKKAPTKAQLLSMLAEDTGLTRTDVLNVLEALNQHIKRSLNRRTGAGYFTIPGLIKIRNVRKARTKARRGVNPFTGEEITIPAKPARNAIKLQALKGLKEML